MLHIPLTLSKKPNTPRMSEPAGDCYLPGAVALPLSNDANLHVDICRALWINLAKRERNLTNTAPASVHSRLGICGADKSTVNDSKPHVSSHSEVGLLRFLRLGSADFLKLETSKHQRIESHDCAGYETKMEQFRNDVGLRIRFWF